MASRLTEKDEQGNWGLKGVRWVEIMPGAAITQEVYEKLYGALWKLKDYEDTGLSPDEVEKVNDFEKSQMGILMKKLAEERNKHNWIPVSERLPETSKMVLVTVHTSEWISDYYCDWVPDSEKIHYPEQYSISVGYLNTDRQWVFLDETMSETNCSVEFGADKSVVYDIVTYWRPLLEPYKEEEYD